MEKKFAKLEVAPGRAGPDTWLVVSEHQRIAVVSDEKYAELFKAAPELFEALWSSTNELDGLSAMFADNGHLARVLDRYVARNRAALSRAVGE